MLEKSFVEDRRYKKKIQRGGGVTQPSFGCFPRNANLTHVVRDVHFAESLNASYSPLLQCGGAVNRKSISTYKHNQLFPTLHMPSEICMIGMKQENYNR